MAQRLAGAEPKASVQIVSAAEGRVRLSVGRLDAVGEPKPLRQLREMVAAMLPQVDLPDLLLEVHAWTGYPDASTHAAGPPPAWRTCRSRSRRCWWPRHATWG
jgi:hypothetical protein